MFTRKSLFVALTVLAMLAMLVPVAGAAPERLVGIEITAPTTAVPALISTPLVDDPATPKVTEGLNVNYTLTIEGLQVYDVFTTAWLVDDHGWQWTNTAAQKIESKNLKTGANPETITLQVPYLPDGWYDLTVCAREVDEFGNTISDPCTTQKHAVRVDNTLPVVTLERPVPGQQGCVWVTGNEYELFGMATDNVEVAKAWFEYSASGNWDDAIVIAATPVAGFPGEYTALWNSSLVPDGTGYIRFVAKDTAGNTSFTAVAGGGVYVCVENHVKINLVKGWNLISTPLLLYSNNVSDVLANVWNPGTGTKWATAPIDKIYTYRNGVNPAWTWWSMAGPDGLTTIEDGYGYWVHAVAPATIEFVGTWESIGGLVTPPEYAVKSGWNLIGYTHWGTPTDNGFFKLVSEYLGFPMMISVESMYRYDAALGRYISVDEMTGEKFMMQGAGYWLALAEGTEGTINP